MPKMPTSKAAPKAAPSTEPALPGFPGKAPEQEGWFATNHLCFQDGKLHQLHKGQGENGLTEWWWFPVGLAE